MRVCDLTKIGVAISTCDRRNVFTETLDHWREHLPPEAVLVVVDDASRVPISGRPNVKVVRHDYRRGIAMTKNRCIAELMDAGVDHLFLADDDVWPKVDGWWGPYVESPEPHLSHQWPRYSSRPDNKWTLKHNDGTHFSICFPRGVLMYATREVIDKVGGMDPAHLIHGGEHVVWQQRIHDAGLTTWPFADVCSSESLFWSLDREQGGTTGSTIPLRDRCKLVTANGRLWDHSVAKGFVPYREGIQGEQDRNYDAAPVLGKRFEDVLDHVLLHKLPGCALEFGTGSGNSLRRIASRMYTYAFDTWKGLPEDWREGFPRGTFACDPPNVPNTRLVRGLVQDTIQRFDFPPHVGLIHFDLDLYSSTAAVLEGIEQRGLVNKVFKPGLVVVFDEFLAYPGHEAHEMRAWNEFADRTNISWTLIGRGPEQLALRIL